MHQQGFMLVLSGVLLCFGVLPTFGRAQLLDDITGTLGLEDLLGANVGGDTLGGVGGATGGSSTGGSSTGGSGTGGGSTGSGGIGGGSTGGINLLTALIKLMINDDAITNLLSTSNTNSTIPGGNSNLGDLGLVGGLLRLLGLAYNGQQGGNIDPNLFTLLNLYVLSNQRTNPCPSCYSNYGNGGVVPVCINGCGNNCGNNCGNDCGNNCNSGSCCRQQYVKKNDYDD